MSENSIKFVDTNLARVETSCGAVFVNTTDMGKPTSEDILWQALAKVMKSESDYCEMTTKLLSKEMEELSLWEREQA